MGMVSFRPVPMNSQTQSSASFLLAFLLFLCACGTGQGESTKGEFPENEAAITDALGRSVSTMATALEVVTIAPGATEIVAAAGGLSRIMAVSNVDSYPPEVLHLPRFSVLPLDIETITAMDPDLIFASNQVNDPRDAATFDRLGIPIFYLETATWTQVSRSIGYAGSLLGIENHARRSMDSLNARIDSLRMLTDSIIERPTAVFLVSDVTSYSFGPGSYVMDIMDWAGVESVTADFDSAAPQLSDEFILTQDPDIIFGSFGPDFNQSTLLEHHPTWRTLSAFKTNQIYSIEADLILRPGPRNVEAAFQIARLAHPGIMSEQMADH